MHAVHTILVPVDFSAASREALRHACRVADAFGASLDVLHVIDNPYMPGAFVEAYASPPQGYFDELDKSARATLESLLTADEKVRYRATFVTRMGSAACEILDYAREHAEIDLIVMATAGRGGVARLLMGSVADKVVRAATCPVLTLHPDAHAAAGPNTQAA